MQLSIVVKVSKLCNLRCAYCYETPWLDDARRMSIPEIRRIFQTISELLEHAPAERRVTFYWQGGEPFVHSIDYWAEIIDVQHEEMEVSGAVVRNEIQSNGTLIRDEHLPLLRRDFHLGLSFDVENHLRITAGGQPTEACVVDVLDWLIAEGVPLTGCIAVISKANIERPHQVADFFLSRDLHFRLLNIYTAIDALIQVRAHAADWTPYLQFCETLLAYQPVVDALGRGLSIEPLTTALSMLEAHRASTAVQEKNDGSREWVLVVDTNGDLYSAGDLYNQRFCYGNVFRDNVAQLIESAGRARRVARGKARIESICDRCFLYRRGCDGSYVANCTPEEARAFEDLGTCAYGWLAARVHTGAAKTVTPCTLV